MNQTNFKRGLSTRILAAIMTFVMAFVFYSSDFSTRAEETKRLYLSEVMLFYGETFADAVKDCKASGYIPFESDLNKSAYENQSSNIRKHTNKDVHEIYGDIGNAVVLGYKTTENRELAITNLSMLQMGIGYDNYKYEEYMKFQRGKFDFMAKTIMGIRDEFSENYAKGSPAANMALQLMDYYKYDEAGMGLGEYILSDKCSTDDLAYLFQHCNGSVANTVFAAMTGAVADYNPDTVFTEGEYSADVQPAEPIPDIDLPELSEAIEDTESQSDEEAPAEEYTSVDNTSPDKITSEDDTTPDEEDSLIDETSSIEELSTVENIAALVETVQSDSALTEEQTVVIKCDPNYGTWADRVSKTGMVEKYNLGYIDREDVKAYANSADSMIDALHSFAESYLNAVARENENGEVTNADLGTNDINDMSEKVIEGAVDGTITEDQADLYYLGIYDMLALYPYDDTMNLAEYIVELGSKDYATVEDKYCIYPLAAAMTHGQIEMLQYNGMGQMVTFLYNNENILKEFDKYADGINELIGEHKTDGENSISVWDGVDKSLFESNIAMTKKTILEQSAGRINDDVKKPYGVQTWLSDVQYKLNLATGILGGVNAVITVGTMIYTHTITSSFTAAACIAYVGSGGAVAAVLGYTGWMMITMASWLGAAAFALLIIVPLVNLLIEHLEKDAMDYAAIPLYAVDANNGKACLYSVVMGSNGKAGDVSAGMGKPAGRWEWRSDEYYLNLRFEQDQRPRWNALYYTLDPEAGSPICLDDNGECFTVQYNDISVPKGKEALKTFNEDTAANMNAYVLQDDATGIYMFYTTEDSLAKINKPKDCTDEESKYISKVMLSVGESETEAKTNLTVAGYKVVDANLTPGRDKNYTYLGYKPQTTKDQAATDLRIATQTTQPAMNYGSAGYGNVGSLKNGDSLYYSSYTQVGEPITTDFMVVNDISEVKEGYEPIAAFGGLPYNFNRELDYELNSLLDMNDCSLFELSSEKVQEKLGKPVYVYFRPSKTYSKAEIEKDGGTAQEYVSGIALYEILPHEGGLNNWKINNYIDYINYYAEKVGAEVYENNLLNGVKYERRWRDELGGYKIGEPRSFFLVTKTYDPKRAIYDIKSYTSAPSSSGLPNFIGSTSTGAYAATEVMLAAVSSKINSTSKYLTTFYGYTPTHDYLNFIEGMDYDSFDHTNSELKMLPEDFEQADYWKDAPYSKIYQNYRDHVTREYTYLRCKNIYIEGAADNKNPLTPKEIAFTDTPVENLSNGKVMTLSGESVESEGFVSVQDVRTPNADSPHNLGFRREDGVSNEQYIYIKRKPVEKAYIASVSVGAFDVSKAAGEGAEPSVKEAYSKMGYDNCIQQLLSSCTDEILPYNLCVFNASNYACIEGFTDTLVSETELQENLIFEVLKSDYGKKLVSVRNQIIGKRVVTIYDKNIGAKINEEMTYNWQLSEKAETKTANFAYVGVSRTDSPSKAVTSLLRFKANEGKDPHETIYVDGNQYTLCGGKIRDVFLGDYYLYQSYDSGAGSPITAVDFGIVPFMNGADTALYAEESGVSIKDKSAISLGSGYSSNYIYCYSNDDTEYIDAIYIGTGDNVFDACSELLAAGAKQAVLYDVRHNTRTGDKKQGEVEYTFIGYSRSKATRRKGEIKKARGVRDIIFVRVEDENGIAPEKIELNGLIYTPAVNSSGLAVPINAADGMYIYCYKDGNPNNEMPLLNKIGICERDRVPDTNELWENILTNSGKRYNLNEGIVTFKDGTNFLTDMFYFTTSVTPITEEIIKTIPVLIFAYAFSDKLEELLPNAFFVGIGFAVLENLVLLTQNIGSVTLFWAITRGFSSGLMHGICTGMVGICISFVKKKRKLFFCGLIATLDLAIVYHSIFNSLVQGPEYIQNYIGFAMPIATYIPIVYFIRKRRKDEAKEIE